MMADVFAASSNGEYRVNTAAIAYNNMRMIPNTNDRALTNIVGVAGSINRKTPQQSFKLNTTVNGTVYNKVNAERDYVTHASFGLDYNYSQPRSQFALRGTYQSDANALKDPAKIDFTGGNENRKSFGVLPSISLSISELTTAMFFGAATATRFTNDAGLNFQDYNDITAGMSLSRHWTPRLSSSLTANAGRFLPVSGVNSIDNAQLQISSRFALSERSNAESALGVFRKTGRSSSGYDDGWLARMSLNTAWSRGRIIMDVSRQLAPTGFGIVSTSDRISFSADYSIASTLSASVSAQRSRTRATGYLGTFFDSTYSAVTLAFSKQLAPPWRTKLSATALQRQYAVNNVGAEDMQARWEIEYAGSFLLN